MIPVCDMKPQYLTLEKEIDKAIKRVLVSGNYILGSEVKKLEKECARFIGMPYAVGVASGTSAIALALRALGLDSESEVIVPANSYPSVWGVLDAGAKPKFCDIETGTLRMDEEKLKHLITKKTRAVLVVHLYGVNMLTPELQRYFRSKHIAIVEDCAQSFGAKRKGHRVGQLGDISIFSFYPTKPLGAYGDGGMVMTGSRRTYEKLMELRMYGEKRRYQSVGLGTNSRLDEVQAAILRVKLKKVKKWITERRQQADIYTKELSSIKGLELLQSPWMSESAFHLYPILVSKRDALQQFLLKRQIQTGIHYPLSLTQVRHLRAYSSSPAPVAENIAKHLLSLPLYNGLSARAQQTVIRAIKDYYSQ